MYHIKWLAHQQWLTLRLWKAHTFHRKCKVCKQNRLTSSLERVHRICDPCWDGFWAHPTVKEAFRQARLEILGEE